MSWILFNDLLFLTTFDLNSSKYKKSIFLC